MCGGYRIISKNKKKRTKKENSSMEYRLGARDSRYAKVFNLEETH